MSIANRESGSSARAKINAAIAAADQALAAVGVAARDFDTVTALLADTSMAYGTGAAQVEAGDVVTTRGEGFSYEVALSSASDQHVTTAGGVKLYALRGPTGAFADTQFGVTRDGTTDDTTALNLWLAQRGKLVATAGVARTTASLLIDGETLLDGADPGVVSYIKPDAAVLEAVKIGTVSRFQGRIRDIVIARASYSGATENVGWALYDASGSVFEGTESRFSKYNYVLKPGNSQRVAYNTFLAIDGTGGFYNLTAAPTGTGFVNENVYLGGRMFATSDTDTHVFVETINFNHNRFIGMALEGPGTQAVYLNGSGAGSVHSNLFENCRVEGTWVNDPYQLGALTLYNTIRAHDLYARVNDLGESNYIETALEGHKLETGVNGVTTATFRRTGTASATPVLVVEDAFSSSGDSYGIDVRAGRDTSTGFAFRAIRASDNLVRASITSNGQMFLARQVYVEQSGHTFEPLRIGIYRIWHDGTNFRTSGGTPASSTDGRILQQVRSSNAAALGAAANAINTAGKEAGVPIYDVSTNRPVWAGGSGATDPWRYADGTTAYTPV